VIVAQNVNQVTPTASVSGSITVNQTVLTQAHDDALAAAAAATLLGLKRGDQYLQFDWHHVVCIHLTRASIM